MDNNFEVWIKYEVDGEFHFEQDWYKDYLSAQNEFIECLNDKDVYAALVISHIEGYKEAIVLAYSNDWADDFIKFPDWAC